MELASPAPGDPKPDRPDGTPHPIPPTNDEPHSTTATAVDEGSVEEMG